MKLRVQTLTFIPTSSPPPQLGTLKKNLEVLKGRHEKEEVAKRDHC